MEMIARTLDPATEIAYWEHRAPEHSGVPTLVLIHGLGLTSQVWIPLIELLKPSFPILAIDVPGYGDSPRGSGELTIDSVAQRIAELINDRHAGEVVLVGHSMGGFIALNLATRLTRLPKQVVLLDSTLWRAYRFIRTPVKLALRYPRILVGLGTAATGALLPHARSLARCLGRTSIGRQLSLWPFVHRPRQLAPEVAQSIFEDMRPGQPLLALRRSTRAFDLSSLLANAEIPLTAISGANDGLIAPVDVRYYREHAPLFSANVTIQECGHWPMVEAPHELRAILVDLLGRDAVGNPGETAPC